MRLVLTVTASVLVVLGVAAESATGDARCCFKATIRDNGYTHAQWGKVSQDQIGEEAALWDWTERMVLEFHDAGVLTLAQLGGRPVKPSSQYERITTSSVQIRKVGGYSPAAAPGACGEFGLKLRKGVVPGLVPRGEADPEDRAQFPKAPYFLDLGSATAREDIGCLYGITISDAFADDQPCTGQHAFRFPAPSIAYFRDGTGRKERNAECVGGHPAGGFVNHEDTSKAFVSVVLQWFPRSRLDEVAEQLRNKHREI